MTHKVLIIEDEIPAAKRLKSLINKFFAQASILTTLDSVEDSIKWLKSNAAPDLIFMDIQLADGQSFDIFTEVDIQVPIIFITAYHDYAIKAFEVNGLDYLLKPIDNQRFKESIKRYLTQKQKPDYSSVLKELQTQSTYKSRFLIKQGDQFIIVPIEQVAFFQFLDGYTHLFTTNHRKFIIDDSIESISSQLNPSVFFQVNRKTILSVSSITKISSWFNSRLKVTTQPKSTEDIIVSRERVKDFKSFLGS